MRLADTGEGRDWFACDDAALPIVARRRARRRRRLFFFFKPYLQAQTLQIGRAHV